MQDIRAKIGTEIHFLQRQGCLDLDAPCVCVSEDGNFIQEATNSILNHDSNIQKHALVSFQLHGNTYRLYFPICEAAAVRAADWETIDQVRDATDNLA